MAIYVGTIEWSYGRMIMFHLATDGEPEELHKFVDKIGVKRKWYQNKGANNKYPHYDICKSKKKLAIALGAIEVNDRELIRKCFRNGE
jgi:hypothetical protein